MGRLFERSDSPPWVIWTCLTVAGLVILLPLLLLTLLAILVGILLFVILSLVAMLMRIVQNGASYLRRLLTGRDEQGRRNVTVLPRKPSDFQ